MMFCDICNQPITPQTKRRPNGVIEQLTGAQEVCTDCFDTIREINWNVLARDAIRRHKAGNKEPADT